MKYTKAMLMPLVGKQVVILLRGYFQNTTTIHGTLNFEATRQCHFSIGKITKYTAKNGNPPQPSEEIFPISLVSKIALATQEDGQ